jgi:hypothetical protein
MPEDISPAEWMTYATVIVGIIVIIARSVPKFLGPIGDAIRDWSDNKRRAQQSATTADIDELKRQVAELQESLSTYRTKARDHSKWDRKVYREMVSRGVDIGFPPDLF